MTQASTLPTLYQVQPVLISINSIIFAAMKQRCFILLLFISCALQCLASDPEFVEPIRNRIAFRMSLGNSGMGLLPSAERGYSYSGPFYRTNMGYKMSVGLYLKSNDSS